MDRKDALTIKGKPYTLVGPELRAGQKAPDFNLTGIDMKQVKLSDSTGKIRLLSVVHSVDTPVCDLQTRRFEEEAARLTDVVIYTISMDLPFAQARYCSAHSIKNLKTLSDYREASFGEAYGVLIQGMRLLSRAIFIIDGEGKVRYAQYVRELTEHPDYDKALQALKDLAGSKVPV
ncbi:MAG: thiol peroxidase [Chloroflexi bacterium]|nr:thiol peroxidase [Chloroflexota bacterium]